MSATSEMLSPRGELGMFTDRDERSIFWVSNFGNLYFLYVSILYLRKLVGISIKDDCRKVFGGMSCGSLTPIYTRLQFS